jgi:hypothetical protein
LGSADGHKVVLAMTFLLVIVAVSASAGLLVYTAWRHDLENGLFALAFAVLSAKMALSWNCWREGYQQSAISHQQARERRKPVDQAMH